MIDVSMYFLTFSVLTASIVAWSIAVPQNRQAAARMIAVMFLSWLPLLLALLLTGKKIDMDDHNGPTNS